MSEQPNFTISRAFEPIPFLMVEREALKYFGITEDPLDFASCMHYGLTWTDALSSVVRRSKIPIGKEVPSRYFLEGIIDFKDHWQDDPGVHQMIRFLTRLHKTGIIKRIRE
jgi:hypothetical protein